MTTQWNLKPFTAEEEVEGMRLASSMKLAPVIGSLLYRRGLKTEEELKAYFNPKLDDLHDPFLMNDMDKAVERLNKAIGRKEKLLIYGDYDVDGCTAVALVYKYLRATGCSENLIDFYIPDRYDEGYGISKRGVDYAADFGAKLVIALDCGIKAVEKVAYAKEKGIDFIICDHHNPDDQLPDAVAVLDAKRGDNLYPFEHLSGCGVGFKLMQAYTRSNGLPESKLFKLLDLVAVSIAADIVPIMGENRILAHFGLRQLNKQASLGLAAIIKTSGLGKKRIDMNDIVFKIGPRINASGRMMNGRESVQLLLAQDGLEASARSANVDSYNDQRRELDKVVTEEAIDMLEELSNPDKFKILVIFRPDWHKGVIGIVASRITERYSKPCIVLSKSGEYITGSARSAGRFDVYHAIEHCKDLLLNFGGHTYAAGLTLKEENLEAFRDKISLYAQENICLEALEPQIDVDVAIDLDAVNAHLLKNLKQMNPFGPDNEKPVFLSRGVRDLGSSRAVGKNKEHLKLDLTTVLHPGRSINAIAFGMAEHLHLVKHSSFDVCYTIEENDYQGQRSLQLLVKDIKPSDS